MAKLGRSHGKYRQASRLLKLVEYVRSRRFGATLAELAEEFRVTDRQIRRDLDMLDEAGYPIETDLNPDGRTRVRLHGLPARSIPLTVTERYGLLAVRRVFDVLAGTPFREDVRSIYSKLAASLDDAQRADLEAFGERFVFVPDGGTKGYEDKDDVMNALLSGVIYRRPVRYRYRRADGKTTPGILEPYAMALYRHGLYVIGVGTPEGAVRHDRRPFVFAVERFEEAEQVRGQGFDVPADFRVDEFFEGAFGIFLGGEPQRVVVDFAAPARARVEERQWHDTQKLKRLPGGGVRLTFHASNLTEVKPWIVGWGPQARVREPASLVEEVARLHREAAALYG